MLKFLKKLWSGIKAAFKYMMKPFKAIIRFFKGNTTQQSSTQRQSQGNTKNKSQERQADALQKVKDFFDNKIAIAGNDSGFNLKRNELMQKYRDDLASSSSKNLMERHHGYIQWLFPNLEPSGPNPSAPYLKGHDLTSLKDYKDKILEHFDLFMCFMGIKYNKEDKSFEKSDTTQWANWIDNSHNNLRVTRILIALTIFGAKDVADAFLSFLKQEAQRSKENDGFKCLNTSAKNSCNSRWNKYDENIPSPTTWVEYTQEKNNSQGQENSINSQDINSY